MKDNKLNKNAQLFNYLRNKLSRQERYAFEKESQSDPFLQDALDGFETLTPEELDSDLLQLQQQIPKAEVKIRKFSPWIGVAASISLFLILGTIAFYYVKPSIQTQNLAKQELTEEAQKMPEVDKAPKPVSGYVEEEKAIENEITSTRTIAENKEQIVATKMDALEDEDKGQAMVSDEKPVIKETLTANEVEVLDENLPLKSEKTEPLVEITSKQEEAAVKPQAQNNFYQETQSVSMSREMAKNARKKQTAEKSVGSNEMLTAMQPDLKDTITLTYRGNVTKHAIPETGIDTFESYLNSNKTKPEGEPILITFEFVIDSRGRFISFMVEDTNIYTNELIRLLKEGPAWIPAVQDSIPLNDTITISVTF